MRCLSGRYRLGAKLGQGGMASVWRAHDDVLDRDVAVKLLTPEHTADPGAFDRARNEARSGARFAHPNVVAVYDFGTSRRGGRGTAYLVMELVEGDPLAAILAKERRISAERTLEILEQAGNALQAAHERGYVHRDVKPGNIMVTPGNDGRVTVKLTDFGIAKAADAAPVTRSGMVMGTAHYIAPEQALGQEAEPSSDVYSLAVVGYECLAGHRPFLSDNAVTVAMMHIRDLPPPLPPDVPPHARAVVEATLVKDPAQRYINGGEFAAAVAAVRAGHPLPTPSGRALIPNRGPTPVSLPGGPPSAPQPAVPGPGTGAFPLSRPPQPPRNRTAVWVVVVVLAVALLTAAAVGVAMMVNGDGDTGGQSRPESSSPVGGSDNGDSGAQPGNEPGSGESEPDAPGEFVEVDERDYLDRPASYAVASLERKGLFPELHDTVSGDEPDDPDHCTVTEVKVERPVLVGSTVPIYCEEEGP